MACLSLYRNYYKATLLQSCILCANVTGKAERQKKQEQSIATMPSVETQEPTCTVLSTVWQLTNIYICFSFHHCPSRSPGLPLCPAPCHTRTPGFSPQSSSQSADMCICFFLTFPVSADSIITYLRMTKSWDSKISKNIKVS